MAKPNLRKLNPMDFTKMTPNRQAKIEAAAAKPLPPVDSYTPNQLAKALHPDVQHLKVSRVVERGGNAKSIYLVPDTSKGTARLAYFSAGQYLSLSLRIGDSFVTRPYSLASSPKEALDGEYMLTVRRANGGFVSDYILDHWKEGAEVTASAPLGEFTYEPLRDAKHVVGLAGGSGITPFRSLAKAIADGDEDAELTLLYGSRTRADALFADEFEALAKDCPKFHYINVLSDEEAEGYEHGFLSAELVKKYAPEGEYSLFVCGPKAMYDFLESELPKLGLRRKFIRHELFGECKDPSKEAGYPGADAASYKLTVRVCGEEKTFDCDAKDTLLVAMEKAGIAAPSHCRSGVCGWCRSRLVSGDVFVPESVDGRREADLIYGYIHPCCTFALSDVVLEVPAFHP